MDKQLMKSEILNKDTIKDFFFILIGCFISSIGTNMFLSHARLFNGGVTGLALIIQYLFKIEAGYIVFLFNIPLLILSAKKLTKRFTIYTIVGSLSLSVSLIITHPIAHSLSINDNLLYCIYGGVVCGVGYGLVFSHNGSTGGTDIISMIIKKKYSNFNIGKINFFLNLSIVVASSILFGLPTALYTLIAMYITSFFVDYVVKGLDQKKLVLIVTDYEEEISGLIINNLNRGVTCLYGRGEYTKKERNVMYTIISLSQLPELKEIVRTIDKRAFITILDATEVVGKGFNVGLR